MKKFLSAVAVAAAAVGASVATGGTVEAGITNCRWSYGQEWGGFPGGGTSYCDWASWNNKIHRIRLTDNYGARYYGPWRHGGQGSSVNIPYGRRVTGAIVEVTG